MISVTAMAIGGGALAMTGAASAAIVGVGPGYFGAGTTTITFDEVPLDSTIPFTIGIAEFAGLAGLVTDLGAGGDSAPPAPSGGAYLFTSSLDDEDIIEVLLSTPQEAVGAYFNVLGGGGDFGLLQVEFYSGDTLIGSLLAEPDEGTAGGFIGASAGDAVIDRVIFRDIDPTVPISFRIDDFQFIPGAGALWLLPMALVTRRRRHR